MIAIGSVGVVLITLAIAIAAALRPSPGAVAPPDAGSVPPDASPAPVEALQSSEMPSELVSRAAPMDGGPAASLPVSLPPPATAPAVAEPVHRIRVHGKPAAPEASTQSAPSAAVDAGADPPIDKEAIRGAIAAITPLVKGCYEAELDRTPDAHGTIKVNFTIVAKDGKGHVDDASIMEDSTLNGFDLQSCVLQEISKATFPMPAGNGHVVVHYPFTFSSTAPE